MFYSTVKARQSTFGDINNNKEEISAKKIVFVPFPGARGTLVSLSFHLNSASYLGNVNLLFT